MTRHKYSRPKDNADGNPRYGAHCEARRSDEWVSFKKWWGGRVFENVRGLTMTRSKLVWAMRNQDGGAHVDPAVRDEAYDRFVRVTDQVGYFNKEKTSWISLNHIGNHDAHWQTIRKIAWEREHSLREAGLLKFL